MSLYRQIKFILPLLILLTELARPVWAEQLDETSLFDFSAQQQPATPSRHTRPISKIAENTTVITAEQIALLNAHTLADVLQTIPGVQLD